jgi:Replication protein
MSVDAVSGRAAFSPYSSVHVLQTKVDLHVVEPKAVDDLPADSQLRVLDGPLSPWLPRLPAGVETMHRHRFWWCRRRAVRDVLAGVVGSPRLLRFDLCGSEASVEVSQDGQLARVVTWNCGDRFCLPCGFARAKIVSQNLVGAVADQTVRFLTLTRRDNGGSLRDGLDHLSASFRRLRASRVWADAVRSSASAVQITRGGEGDHWHVHLHALLLGVWVDHGRLVDAWNRASGGSSVVHVRAVADAARDVRYVCRYSARGFDDSVLDDLGSLPEAIKSLSGRRMLATSGGWRGLKLSEKTADKIDWKPQGTLVEVVQRALSGDAQATALLMMLRTKVSLDAGSIRFETLDADGNLPKPGTIGNGRAM